MLLISLLFTLLGPLLLVPTARPFHAHIAQLLTAMNEVNLSSHLKENGWFINQSPGDGHCLLYSFISSWKSQINDDSQITLESIKHRLVEQTLDNLDSYLPFSAEPCNTPYGMQMGLNDYIIHKKYDQPYGDLAPVILAKAYNIQLCILDVIGQDENKQDIVCITRQDPNPNSEHTLVVHKKGKHYNGIGFSAHYRSRQSNHLSMRCRSANTTPFKYSSHELREIQNQASCKIKRSLRKSLFKLHIWGQHHGCNDCNVTNEKPIPVRIRPSRRRGMYQNMNYANLIQIHITPEMDVEKIPIHISEMKLKSLTVSEKNGLKGKQQENLICPSIENSHKKVPIRLLDFGLLNTHSVNTHEKGRLKTDMIKDLLVSKDLDCLALTETWLKQGNDSSHIIKELCPTGYSLCHEPRKNRRGGGVALLYKNDLKAKKMPVIAQKSFEYQEVKIRTMEKTFHILIVYRPPPNSINKSNDGQFFEEFATYLEKQSVQTGQLIIVGDFNFHVDDMNDAAATKFLDLMTSMNFQQHVTESTHEFGHTLDLVFTYAGENIIKDIEVGDRDPLLSDHCPIHFKVVASKPRHERRRESYRKIRSIDLGSFLEDLGIALENLKEFSAKSVHICFRNVLDKHAPVKERIATMRPKNNKWITDDIKKEQAKKSQLERKWRKNGKNPADRALFRLQADFVNKMETEAKLQYFTNQIIDSGKDQKLLYKVIDMLLYNRDEVKLPSHESLSELVNRFSTFFIEKIHKIQRALDQEGQREHETDSEEKISEKFLTEFDLPSIEEVKKLILGAPCKTCDLDAIPTKLLKDCIHLLCPTITTIITKSLSTGTVSPSFKEALLTPLLKKPQLDTEVLNNYRPVSNLNFISKVLERIVATQIIAHIEENKLGEEFQSAYRKHHSTETALVRVHNDIAMALAKKRSVLLVLLDLSAAFDTVDHGILLARLRTRIGITGTALKWCQSYLTDRSQSVVINGVRSDSAALTCGVPQGSVLGPLLFTIYMLPLGDILREHGLPFHLYADDTQIYLPFNARDSGSIDEAKKSMECCVRKIRSWMRSNKLKLNDEKTEIVVVQPKHLKQEKLPDIKIGDSLITPSSHARNIGIIFDDTLSMDKQITATCQAANFQIRRIGRIRKYLTFDAAKTVVHAYVTSRLDNGNALLVGAHKYQKQKLQHTQHSAARLVKLTRKHDHITPVLKQLHWLPIEQRIYYKICLLAYKAQNGQAPAYLCSLLKPYSTQRSLRSSNKSLLDEHRTENKYDDMAFENAAPKYLNNLPQDIRQASSLESFKSSLKTCLFRRYFDAV